MATHPAGWHDRHRQARRLAKFLTEHLGPGTDTDLTGGQLADATERFTTADWTRIAGWSGEALPTPAVRRLVAANLRGDARVVPIVICATCGRMHPAGTPGVARAPSTRFR